jgi:Cellulase (glycosyl hydrolase family 5)
MLALTLVALLSLAPAGDATRGKGSPQPPALLDGVNISSVHPGAPAGQADHEIAVAKALGAKVVRTNVPWSALEPLGPGQLDASALAFTDRLVDDAAAAGIRVIMTLDSTPCWASSEPGVALAGCNGPEAADASSWPPSNPADFAAFAALLAGRYGSRLAAIEIWNEPDQSNEAYFAGPNKAKNYAALVRAAYPAIKAANAGVPVLAGSLVGTNGAFLRLLYAAGMKGYYDGLAVHYYTLTLGALRSIHEVQLANGDRAPLWLDEFGWSSCWPQRIQQEQGCVTRQVQAANLTNTLRALARARYVAAAVIYKLQDSPSEEFGLLSNGGAHKPSYSAFAHALSSPLGNVSRVALNLRRAGKRVVASGSGPVGDFMSLEVLQGTLPRYRTLFTLDRFNRFSIKLPAALGTQGLRVRVYQYWSGPGRATQKQI